MDVDAKSNWSKDLFKVLATHERKKKKKYLEACLGHVVSRTDGLLSEEAKTLLKKLSALLTKKWE
jgi:hypothetical protein